MKIECECGKLITDGTDFLRYKGYILADQDHDHFYDAIDEAIEKSGPSAADKENACMDVRCFERFSNDVPMHRMRQHLHQ
ncbi:MAG: hypothetical protein IPN71_18510 [Fibrobacteres bacterium]|nr:hypothetical protein [Fibrobacterota bacterium]